MEADFLGLKWKPSNENVKEKTRDMDANPGYNNLSDNYLSPSTQFIPSSTVQEDMQRKVVQNYSNMTRKTFPFLDERNSWHNNINHLSNTCIASAGGYTVASPFYNNHSVGGSTLSIDQQPPISSTVDLMNVEDGSRCKDKLSIGPSCMTIFYDNVVYAYDDITPEKAEAVMRMANKEGSYLVASDISSNQAQHSPGQIRISPQSTAATYTQTVPQARKASVDRFMEKRKERYH